MITTLIISIILAWVIAKLIKFWFDIHNGSRLDWRTLTHDGGMPSTHTALVVSLAMAMILEHVSYYVIVVCVVLALIVINDALKVRWITGEQSKVLNRMNKGKKGYKILEEEVGHTPLEVAIGIIIGLAAPILTYALA